MDVNLALVALVFWIGLSLAVGAYLDHRQHTSHAVTVVRPRYISHRRR